MLLSGVGLVQWLHGWTLTAQSWLFQAWATECVCVCSSVWFYMRLCKSFLEWCWQFQSKRIISQSIISAFKQNRCVWDYAARCNPNPNTHFLGSKPSQLKFPNVIRGQGRSNVLFRLTPGKILCNLSCSACYQLCTQALHIITFLPAFRALQLKRGSWLIVQCRNLNWNGNQEQRAADVMWCDVMT